MISSDGPPSTLLLSSAFFAPKAQFLGVLTFGNFLGPMLWTDHRGLASFAAMHSSVLNAVDRLKVIRATACAIAAEVVHWAGSRPMQCFEDQAMNTPEDVIDTDVSIAVLNFRTGPYPAIVYHDDTGIEPGEDWMCKHTASILRTDFKSSLSTQSGSARESAVGSADAPRKA